MKVALFVTCLTDTFYPQVAVSVVRVLRRLGCEVDFPQAQTCCGQPMMNTGYPDEACTVLRHFLKVFEPYDYIVCPSGSCAGMVREHAARLLKGTPDEAKAAAVSHQVYEFVEFLTQVLKVDFASLGLTFDHSVTFHYACHLRGLHLKPDVLEPILQACQGCTFKPLEVPEQCCGFGGTFAEKYSDISEQMGKSKLQDIAATGAQLLICNEGGCGMNIGGLINRRWREDFPGKQAPGMIHIAELLDRAWPTSTPAEQPPGATVGPQSTG